MAPAEAPARSRAMNWMIAARSEESCMSGIGALATVGELGATAGLDDGLEPGLMGALGEGALVATVFG